MARNPPPIPKIPVIDPMSSEIRISSGSGMRVSALNLGSTSIEKAAKIKISANPEVIKRSDNLIAIDAKPKFVINPIPTMTRASRYKTWALLAFAITPESAARNTIARAAVVALLGSKPKKNIKIGTESIAPPAPTKPRTAPIKVPAANAPTNSTNLTPIIH